MLDNVTSRTPQIGHSWRGSEAVLDSKVLHFACEQFQRVFVWVRGAFRTEGIHRVHLRLNHTVYYDDVIGKETGKMEGQW